MGFSLRRRIRRSSKGVSLKIEDEERQLLGHLIPQLRDVLVGVGPSGEVDKGMRRLFPTAHPEDVDKETEFQTSQRDRLLAVRLDRLDLVESTLSSEHLTDSEHSAWITTVNDLRLVLGTRLDVGEEDDHDTVDPEDESGAAAATYHYLGHLLSELIEVVEFDEPDDPDLAASTD